MVLALLMVISDVYSPKGVRTVQDPVWSEADGQDDIRWYEATRQTDGVLQGYCSSEAPQKRNWSLPMFIFFTISKMDGHEFGVAHKTKLLVRSQSRPYHWSHQCYGSYDLVISNLVCATRFQRSLVPTWSKNGQRWISSGYKALSKVNGDYYLR